MTLSHDCGSSLCITTSLDLGSVNPEYKLIQKKKKSNKVGSITHSLKLKIATKGIEKVMRFLVTDIGNEDVLLGYPWLATFRPKFRWKDTIIKTNVLPIIISSTHPINSQTVIAGLQTQEEKEEIV